MHDADNDQIVMAAGAERVGYKECSTGNMAINSRPRDGRPATIQDGFCFQGIRSNAKWSTLKNCPATAGPEPKSIIYSRNQRFQICDRCRLALENRLRIRSLSRSASAISAFP
jgi:hypothetical protein